MIRIAVFAPLLITGGTQRHLQQVLPRLDRSRFDTQVYTLRPGGAIEGELRAGRFDVVHGYQWRPALVGTLAGRLAGVPLLLASKRSLTGDDARARFAW